MTSKKFFTTTLLDFFSESKISLPWRGYSPEPYKVLVSETMLQQTQVARVVEKYTEFIALFPTIYDVASASKEEILKIWNGLGYNSRALRLKKTCEVIVSNHNGLIPNNYDQLRALPGIGDYTASAILCFAFRIPIEVVDVNVIRVFSRFFSKLQYTTDVISEKEIRESLKKMLPKENSSEFFQAIMDIARMYCKKSSPLCNECPLSTKCLSNNTLVFKQVSKRIEPSYLGFPRRIWRGRILKVLTQQSPLEFKELLDQLQMNEHSEWVMSVLQFLEKDTLVEFNEKTGMIRISS